MSYRLLDFGEGRKFEEFDSLKIIRPSIYANEIKPSLGSWDADYEFLLTDGRMGEWHNLKAHSNSNLKSFEYFNHESLKYKLEFNQHGNLGVFPEHLNNPWLIAYLSNQSELQILNLFSYSGTNILPILGTTNYFTHVDSSKNAMRLLKENIALNNVNTNSRFINEDVITFLEKEVRRQNKYDVIILDPPTFGRGLNNEIFKFKDDVYKLLELINNLKSENFHILLLTHHTDDIDNQKLKKEIEDLMNIKLELTNSYIKDTFGKTLPSGYILKYVKTL
jgi:23S rRNA (cytosine1962-C5)-methyltransferase